MNQYKITINSLNRDNYLSTSMNDFTYVIPTFTDKVKSVYVESAQIYNSEYTITTGVNDDVFWSVWPGGSPTKVNAQLPQGYYTAPELATAVETLMNANKVSTETYTVTYDSFTNRFNIVSSVNIRLHHNPDNFQARFGTAWVPLGYIKNYTDVPTDLAGWYVITNESTTQLAPYPPKLSSNYYKIGISDLKSNQLDNTGIYPVCAIVPNEVPIGQMNSYKPAFPFKIPTQNYFDATKIRVKILNDFNNVANLQNDFSIILVIETH